MSAALAQVLDLAADDFGDGQGLEQCVRRGALGGNRHVAGAVEQLRGDRTGHGQAGLGSDLVGVRERLAGQVGADGLHPAVSHTEALGVRAKQGGAGQTGDRGVVTVALVLDGRVGDRRERLDGVVVGGDLLAQGGDLAVELVDLANLGVGVGAGLRAELSDTGQSRLQLFGGVHAWVPSR